MGKANEQAKDKPSLLNRWLNGIEKVGNKLPHPISIFAILVLFVIVLSAVCEMEFRQQVNWLTVLRES